jgi:polyhydroxyalkanoate synthesis regulator protein
MCMRSPVHRNIGAGAYTVVIKKYGKRRRLYNTAREHSIRFATASGQMPVS